MVGCNSSFKTSANTGDFSIRLVTAKMEQNCLKRTLVAKITRVKVAKKGDLLSLPFPLFHNAFPELSEVRSPKGEIGRMKSVVSGGLLWSFFRFK